MKLPSHNPPSDEANSHQSDLRHSQLIDWFHEGQSRTVTIGEVEVTVRLVARKGRRGRIAIVAPAGATFRSTAD